MAGQYRTRGYSTTVHVQHGTAYTAHSLDVGNMPKHLVAVENHTLSSQRSSACTQKDH
jgi:hypothetical protein